MSPKKLVPDPLDPANTIEVDESNSIAQPAQEAASDVTEGHAFTTDAMVTDSQLADMEERLRRAEQRAAKRAVTHVVEPGDTLSGIADKYYNDAGRWPEIYEANRDVIGDNPNLILVGQELKIP